MVATVTHLVTGEELVGNYTQIVTICAQRGRRTAKMRVGR